jgi:hypothetical protein
MTHRMTLLTQRPGEHPHALGRPQHAVVLEVSERHVAQVEHNRVWLGLVLIAHDLLARTQCLALTGELARCEPKRLRYRLLHVAGRLALHARAAILRIDARWPCAAR